MGSIADKLSYLIEAKDDIKESIESHDIEVPDDLPLKNYAKCISEIKSKPNIAYGNTAPSDINKLWVKTNARKNVVVAPHTYKQDLYAIGDPMPSKVVSPAVAAVGTKIYTFGGSTSSPYTNQINVLDTVTRTVKTLSATLPTACVPGPTVAVGTKIYIFGGYYISSSYNRVTVSAIYVFDTETNTITTLGQSFTDYTCAVAAVGTKIYFVGGQNDSSIHSTIKIFDTETNTFSSASATLPQATYGACASVVGADIYIFGGETGRISFGAIFDHKVLDQILKFDTVNGTITTLNIKLPKVAEDLHAAVVGTNVYIFNLDTTIYVFDATSENISSTGVVPPGIMSYPLVSVGDFIYIFGKRTGDTEQTVNIFNTNDYSFSGSYAAPLDIPALPMSLEVASCGFGVAAIGDTTYLLGGYDGSTYLNTIYSFNSDTGMLTKLNVTLPVCAAYFGVAAVGDNIYLFGGYDGSNALNTIMVFNVKECAVATLDSTIIEAAYDIGVAAIGTKIYLYGGQGDNDSFFNSISVFDLYTAEVSLTSLQLPIALSATGVAAVGDKIYLFGGQSAGGWLRAIFVHDTGLNNVIWMSQSMPNPVCNVGTIAVNNRIYLFGGYDGEYCNTVYVFHPDSDTLASLHVNPIHKSSRIGISSIGDSIYLFGGMDSDVTCLNAIRQLNTAKFLFPEHLRLIPNTSYNNAFMLESGHLDLQLGIYDAYAGSATGLGERVDAYLCVENGETTATKTYFNSNSAETFNAAELSINIECFPGNLIIAAIVVNGDFELNDGWNVLSASNKFTSGYQLVLASKYASKTIETMLVRQAGNGWMAVNMIAMRGQNISFTDNGYLDDYPGDLVRPSGFVLYTCFIDPLVNGNAFDCKWTLTPTPYAVESVRLGFKMFLDQSEAETVHYDVSAIGVQACVGILSISGMDKFYESSPAVNYVWKLVQDEGNN